MKKVIIKEDVVNNSNQSKIPLYQITEIHNDLEILERYLKLGRGELYQMIFNLVNGIKQLIHKYENEGDYYIDENDKIELITSKVFEDLRKIIDYE